MMNFIGVSSTGQQQQQQQQSQQQQQHQILAQEATAPMEQNNNINNNNNSTGSGGSGSTGNMTSSNYSSPNEAQGSNNLSNNNTAHPNFGQQQIQEDFDQPGHGIKTVEIVGFSTHKESFYTPIFKLCSSNWRLLIFPEGNNSPGNISIFLDYYDIGLNPLYEKEANLTLTLINPLDSKKNVKKSSNHKFSFKGVNWGFVSFLNLQLLLKPENGYLINDTLKIKVEIVSPPTIDNSDPLNSKPYGKFSYSLTNFSHHFENFYSPTYYVCGSNWRIYIFPNGYSSPNYFSVYLDLLDVKFKPLMSKHLFFAIEIVNQKNPERNLKKWVDHQYDDKNMNFGFPKFVLLTTLLSPENGYIVDDTIIINIEFTVMSSNCTEPSPNFEIESKLGEPYCGKFTFYSKKNPNIDLIFSPTYRIAGSNWQLVSYPLENLTDYFSIYLDLVDIKTKPLLRKHISFAIEIVNQLNPAKNFKKYISNVYSYNSFSWLFQKFMKVQTLYDPKFGFIKNDTIIINVELIVISSDFLKPIPFNHDLSIDIAPKPNLLNCVDENHQSNRLEEMSDTHTFHITNFSTLEKSFYSPVFDLKGTNWRFYIFPKGNSVQNFFSLYLDYVDPKTKPKIRQYICFVLEVVNNKYPSRSEKKYSFHTFCYSSVNWGFKKFISLDTIKEQTNGFIEDDTLTVKVTIYFLSQSILDTKHLLSYSNEKSKHIQLSLQNESNNNTVNNESMDTNNAIVLSDLQKKQKSEEESYYYHSVKLTMDSDFEKSSSFDLVDFTNHTPIKIRKTSTMLELKLQIQMIHGLAFERQRIWFWDNNGQNQQPQQQQQQLPQPQPQQNHGGKPSKVTRCPVVLDDEDLFVQYMNNFGQLEMRFHLEISNSPTPNDKNLFFEPIVQDSSLVFFKYYDPYKQKIEFIASKVCSTSIPISSLIPFLNLKIGNPMNAPLLIYGEISMNLICQMDPNRTLKSYEVSHGDIIFCQNIQPLRGKPPLPFVSDYFNYVFNKVNITFQILNYRNINSDTPFSFKLEVLKGMNYMEVLRRVAEIIQTFPQNLNLYSVSLVSPINQRLIVQNEKSFYESLVGGERKTDLIMVEVKETYLPAEFLRVLDGTHYNYLRGENSDMAF